MKIKKHIIKPILITTLTIALFACDNAPTSENNAQNEVSQKENQSQVLSPSESESTEIVEVTEEKPKFIVLEDPLSVSTGEKIEVLELFWYGCGHCFALEPFVKKWQENKPDNAEFIKVPAIFSQRWSFHGQAFYTMQALGVLEQANDAFFNQIHKLRKPINDLPALVEFLSTYEKTESDVTAAFNSFEVNTKLSNAIKITKQSKATGVPAIVIDGKFLTGVGKAGGQSQLFDLIDELVEKAENER